MTKKHTQHGLCCYAGCRKKRQLIASVNFSSGCKFTIQLSFVIFISRIATGLLHWSYRAMNTSTAASLVRYLIIERTKDFIPLFFPFVFITYCRFNLFPWAGRERFGLVQQGFLSVARPIFSRSLARWALCARETTEPSALSRRL